MMFALLFGNDLHSAEMSKFAVVSLSPREHLSVHSQCHGVAPSRMHSDLLHHVVTECSDLTRDRDGPTGQTKAQPAVGGLSTRVNLPLNGHWNSTEKFKTMHSFPSSTLWTPAFFLHSPAKRLFEPPATWTTLRAERVSEKEGTLICDDKQAEEIKDAAAYELFSQVYQSMNKELGILLNNRMICLKPVSMY